MYMYRQQTATYADVGLLVTLLVPFPLHLAQTA